MVIRIKSPERDYKHQLNVKLVLHAQSSTNKQSIVRLEVTDPDPEQLFLYTLDCAESDFHIFKVEQHFHSSFQEFPKFIIANLQTCQSTTQLELSNFDQVSNGHHVPAKLLYCTLEVGVSDEGVLRFEEKTPYNMLQHASLKLKKANNVTLLNHLALKLKESLT